MSTHSSESSPTLHDDALPKGFRWSATTAGIKASGRPDLALAVADSPVSAAVMYTTNQLAAAPVLVGREHLAASDGTARAVLVNAGNANCATGEAGIQAARQSCERLAEILSCQASEVVPSSTGIIGVPLPVDKLIAALPSAVAGLGGSSAAAHAFANAILTTDTHEKVAQRSVILKGVPVHLFGCCKGAGMIAPQMATPHATMLAYLFTDLGIAPAELQPLLTQATDRSFNSITVDGDTSTNDTVLLLASGASNAAWSILGDQDRKTFAEALNSLCHELAYKIVDDGEGVTHVITLRVTGASSDAAAGKIARSVAESPLCKTAWSSADPNWGRILAAAGYAGVPFNPAEVTVDIGGLRVFDRGVRSDSFDEAAVHNRMRERAYEIAIDLGQGTGTSTLITCDLTEEYVRINADYST